MLRLIIQGGLALFALLALVGVVVIAPLDRDVAELRDRVSALEKPAPSGPPPAGLAVLQDRVKSLSERLGKLEKALPAAGAADLERLAGELRILAARMTAMETAQPAFPGDIASMSRQLAALTARVDALAQREPPAVDFTPLRTELYALARRVSAVEGVESATPADIAGLQRGLDAMTARLEGLERRDVPPPIDFVLLQREVKTMSERFAALETRAEPGSLAPLREEMNRIAGRVAALEQRPAAPPVDLQALSRQVERLGALVGTMEQRRAAPLTPDDRWSQGQEVNKLAYRLEALEDERRGTAAGIAALREELRILEQRIGTLAKRLPAAPR